MVLDIDQNWASSINEGELASFIAYAQLSRRFMALVDIMTR